MLLTLLLKLLTMKTIDKIKLSLIKLFSDTHYEKDLVLCMKFIESRKFPELIELLTSIKQKELKIYLNSDVNPLDCTGIPEDRFSPVNMIINDIVLYYNQTMYTPEQIENDYYYE